MIRLPMIRVLGVDGVNRKCWDQLKKCDFLILTDFCLDIAFVCVCMYVCIRTYVCS